MNQYPKYGLGVVSLYHRRSHQKLHEAVDLKTLLRSGVDHYSAKADMPGLPDDSPEKLRTQLILQTLRVAREGLPNAPERVILQNLLSNLGNDALDEFGERMRHELQSILDNLPEDTHQEPSPLEKDPFESGITDEVVPDQEPAEEERPTRRSDGEVSKDEFADIVGRLNSGS